MKQVMSLRYGVIFKKAFSQPDIFKGFVRDFLGIQLEIDRVETEKAFPEAVGKVASRFDLFAEDVKNRIIVDIQHERHSDHYNRFLHYHCAAVLEQAANFAEYNPRLTVFTIVVLTSGDWHQHDVSAIDFDPKTLDGQPLKEIFHKILYVCPKYLNQNTPEPYREWMRAIQDSLDGQVDETSYTLSEVLRLFNLIETDTISPEERARIMDEYRQEKYVAEKVKEELENIREEGKAEGLEKGKIEEAKRTAKLMLCNGLEMKLISDITGLTEEEIRQLAE